jgi:hypothetical protein
MQTAQWSRRAYAFADGGSDGGRFTGSKSLQAACAAAKAGEDELIPGTLRLKPVRPEVGSGKLDTPCERMQRAKLSPSRCASAGVGFERAPAAELELRGELEPHAASTAPARIAAMIAQSRGATRDMAQ